MARKTMASSDAEDVYEDQGPKPTFALHLTIDGAGSFVIGDLPEGADGTFSVIIENQYGRPGLHAWATEDIGNDPRLSMYLDTGDRL
jgi:hypothetical protein